MTQSNLKSVLEDIFEPGEDVQHVDRPCRDNLYAYVEAELDGKDAKALFPEVGPCLEMYPDVRQEYDELKTLFVLEREDNLVIPPVAPTFDFSYLDRPLWKLAGSTYQQVQRLFTELQVRIGRELAAFRSIPEPLRLAPATLLATRSQKREGKELPQVLPIPTIEDDLTFSMVVGPLVKSEASLTINIKQTSSQDPINKVRVTVMDGENRLLARKLTREDGAVTFPGVGAGSYFVQIKYQDKIWELPIMFTSEEDSS